MDPIQKLENQFRDKIDEAWTAFSEALEEGQDYQDAEDEYYNILEEAIEEYEAERA